jgi:hypothetical protein
LNGEQVSVKRLVERLYHFKDDILVTALAGSGKVKISRKSSQASDVPPSEWQSLAPSAALAGPLYAVNVSAIDSIRPMAELSRV